MACTVSVYKDLNLVFTEYSGFVDTSQLSEMLSATFEHPDYRPGMVELTDVSDVTSTNIDYNQMLSHRSRMATYYGDNSIPTEQYVVASTSLGFGMVRMYQTVVEDIPNMNLHLFRSEREALQAMRRQETSIAELLRS